MKAIDGLATTVDSGKGQQPINYLQGLRYNQPYEVYMAFAGRARKPVVNVALVSHTQSTTVNCHQLLHKQMTPKKIQLNSFSNPVLPSLAMHYLQ